jgi:hypothetical protein
MLLKRVAVLTVAWGCKALSSTVDAPVEAGVDASVRIATTEGDVTGPDMMGWVWSQDTRVEDDFTVHELKWKRLAKGAGGLVFLYAKDYIVKQDETLTTLKERDWRSYFGSILPTIGMLDVHPTVFAGMTALSVSVDGSDPNGGPTSIREVYVPVHGHTLITTASGPTDQIHKLDKELGAWRDAVTFKALSAASR